MTLEAPYLDAIQALPGDTPSQKYRWIAQQIKESLDATEDLEELVEHAKIPRVLAPFIQIEAARIQLKRITAGSGKVSSKKAQSFYEAVAEALKSEDSMIVHRALQVKSFFDGSNKAITNTSYFFDQLLPHVSLNTRTKIIKTLGIKLTGNPQLAEELFSAALSTYGLRQALPLLPACSGDFIFKTIHERRITLPLRIMKILFAKNPDLVVKYLRLSNPKTDENARYPFKLDIHDYSCFFVKLIKKRFEAFIELYEMHEDSPPNLNLTSTCEQALWKQGKEYLKRKPRLYMNLVPLKLIDHATMESIFAKLLPEKVLNFSTDNCLKYLEHYPEEKRLQLLLDSYKKNYEKDLLADSKNVTPQLMLLLPPEERAKQARIKLNERIDCNVNPLDYVTKWRCYLPVAEVMPEIKEQIATTSEMELRAILVCEMIYTCKVNRDDIALQQVLTYWRDRHRNEQAWFTTRVMMCLLEEYNLVKWSESLWSILFDIVKRCYVKGELFSGSSTTTGILEAAIEYRIEHILPFDDIINILVDVNAKLGGYGGTWNILTNNPEYERRCLDACLAVVSQRYDSLKAPWKTQKNKILYRIVSAIYEFNTRHKVKRSKIKPMSIKDYPWLLKAMEEMACKNNEDDVYTIRYLQTTLLEHEKELYARIWPKLHETLAEVHTGEALTLLRRNPNKIRLDSSKYFRKCRYYSYSRCTQRFLKACRWYKGIPLKFVDECVKDIRDEKCSALSVLATLLHGQTFTKFVEPLIPTEKSIDIEQKDAKNNYCLASAVPAAMSRCNPPVPLDLVTRMCEGDYLFSALSTMVNTCRRTSLPKVIAFAKYMSSKRVSARKHAIRMMHMVAPFDELRDFLLSLWQSEDHHSIRQVIYEKSEDLFRTHPGPITWSLIQQIISSLTPKDEQIISRLRLLERSVPDEFLERYFRLMFQSVDRLVEEGLNPEKMSSYISQFLDIITIPNCNALPEEFTAELLRRFLFHSAVEVAESASMFVKVYLQPPKDKLDSRLRVVTDIYMNAVKIGWNVPDPKQLRFFPINYHAPQMISKIVSYRTATKDNVKIFEALLEAYTLVLTPQMDARSYLLLVYAIARAETNTPKEYGLKIGKLLKELTTIFSPYLTLFLSDVLEYYLSCQPFTDVHSDEKLLDFMEGLVEVGNTESLLVAAKFLSSFKGKDQLERYDSIVQCISESDDPAVKSILRNYINRTERNRF